MATIDPTQKYFDALIASYDILNDAATKSGERGVKVGKQFAADIARGQREALELGKRLAAKPNDPSFLYTAVLEATTGLQERALAFAQVAYEETVNAGADARQTIEKLVEANKETSQAAVEAFRAGFSGNPIADILRPAKAATATAAKKAETASV